jgi:hypothetical protein
MKHLLILSLVALIATSCTKTQCYQCVSKSKPASLWPNEPFVEAPAVERCGWTKEDMQAYVKANTYSRTSQYGYGAVKITMCSVAK